jgi:hypothetical protein
MTLYSIKPYAFDFLRSLNTFYEVIGYARLPHNQIWQIVQHFETQLNEQLIESEVDIPRSQKNEKKSKNLKMRGQSNNIRKQKS